VRAIELLHEEAWATVLRVALADGVAWFKACAPKYAFEARLTAELSSRWPGRVADVLAFDSARAWLLLADAGTPIRIQGNPPEAWLEVLPEYAQLQCGEIAYADDHVAHGVPDLRLDRLPALYEELGLDARLEPFAGRFAELTAELADAGIPPTVQHDDLHYNNVYTDGKRLRVLDWGDASISHPFFSLVETFRFLEETLPLGDPWYARLRDAYLEPWGRGLEGVFDLALRVGTFAHLVACVRPRELMAGDARVQFDAWLAMLVERALPLTLD
jgi:hypothetical protein